MQRRGRKASVMADPRAFLTLGRAAPKREPVEVRTRHWREFYEPLPEVALREQGVEGEAPFMTLSFLALSVIPDLKLTDRGLVDVAGARVVPLAV